MHWIELLATLFTLFLLCPLIGNYISNVFSKEPTLLDFALNPIERSVYNVSGINQTNQQSWLEYGTSLFLFNLIGFFILLLILLFQNSLPLNPEEFEGVPLLLAINTSISFVTNTNWQSYSGETTLSYFSQMLGLTVQNFLSAATGISVLFVLIRGFIRSESDTVGNFFVDLVRITLYILLPLSIIFSIFLIQQGVPESLSPYAQVETLEKENLKIPLGPVATQVAIKQLGSNGGGFFGTNSAHPFENPTPLSNFFQHIAILLIPISLLFTFGKILKAKKHAKILFLAMSFFWLILLPLDNFFQHEKTPNFPAEKIFEGVETRFGLFDTILWSNSTTATSNGSVNGMLSSLSPLSSGIALFNITLGEIIFGGVGVGLASMIMFVIMTIFLSGLMVGRSPSYLGKKIEKHEMIAVTTAIILPSFLTLVGTGISLYFEAATSSILNKGPHGLSEILYAFASTSFNNGSSFAGLNTNTDFYNILLSFAMLFGRVAIILPTLALGGLFAKKKTVHENLSDFSSDNWLFFILLISVILITSGLTFLPVLSMGPIAEHLLSQKGVTF